MSGATQAITAPAQQAAATPLEQQLDLRDIRPPAEPSLWPPAPGWWLVASLLLLALASAGYRLWRGWRRERWRRRVLAELDAWQDETAAPAIAAGVSALLKRAALSRFRRRDVATLTGDAWLDFLDHTGGDGRFQHGPGRLLAEGPYAPATDLDARQRRALLDLARVWLRRNL
jgi:hypothetical protein